MKYTREQLMLIAIMLKNQHGDKTFRELFKVNCVDDVKLSDMWLRFGSDIDFTYSKTERLLAWISCNWSKSGLNNYIAIPLKGEGFARIDIVDVIKVLSFEDKI